MSNTINFEEFKKEQKRRERKEKFINGVNTSVRWVNNNKNKIVGAVGAATTVIGIGKKISKTVNKAATKHYNDTHYYDHSAGEHIRIKKLNSKQKAEVRRRHSEGEGTYYDIYKKMGLLR